MKATDRREFDVNPSDEGYEIAYPGYARNHWKVGRDAAGFPLAIRDMINDGVNEWRFSHVCNPPRRPDMNVRVAPLLTNVGQPGGHQIVSTDPLHIEPSILCDDCGLHGWVRDGRWVNA